MCGNVAWKFKEAFTSLSERLRCQGKFLVGRVEKKEHILVRYSNLKVLSVFSKKSAVTQKIPNLWNENWVLWTLASITAPNSFNFLEKYH